MSVIRTGALVALALVLAACADDAPTAARFDGAAAAAKASNPSSLNKDVAALRSATARYHRVEVAEAEGYAAGTGGTIEATIQPDDGSPAHVPTDEVLARATVPSDDAFPRVEFEPAVPLVEGALYHVVFTNVDPAPTENFVSVNSLFVEPPITPRQAQYTDSEWAQLLDYGDGWELRPEYTPILQLEYSDGTFEGVGYMESWIEAAKTISGPARARESFDISGGDLTVDQAHIRLGRAEGEDPLIVRLETVDGRTLASGEVPAVRFPLPEDGEEPLSTWVTVTFDQPAVLVDRHRYHLVLETTPATEYVIHGIRKGSAVGFEPPTYFAEGVAEFDPGDGWVAFDPGWRGPLPQADLQFYLE